MDDKRLSKNLKLKGDKKGFFSSKSRKVNYVICVLNGLSVLNVIENAGGALEEWYIQQIVSTFNCPFLSFKGIFWTSLCFSSYKSDRITKMFPLFSFSFACAYIESMFPFIL